MSRITQWIIVYRWPMCTFRNLYLLELNISLTLGDDTIRVKPTKMDGNMIVELVKLLTVHKKLMEFAGASGRTGRRCTFIIFSNFWSLLWHAQVIFLLDYCVRWVLSNISRQILTDFSANIRPESCILCSLSISASSQIGYIRHHLHFQPSNMYLSIIFFLLGVRCLTAYHIQCHPFNLRTTLISSTASHHNPHSFSHCNKTKWPHAIHSFVVFLTDGQKRKLKHRIHYRFFAILILLSADTHANMGPVNVYSVSSSTAAAAPTFPPSRSLPPPPSQNTNMK